MRGRRIFFRAGRGRPLLEVLQAEADRHFRPRRPASRRGARRAETPGRAVKLLAAPLVDGTGSCDEAIACCCWCSDSPRGVDRPRRRHPAASTRRAPSGRNAVGRCEGAETTCPCSRCRRRWANAPFRRWGAIAPPYPAGASLRIPHASGRGARAPRGAARRGAHAAAGPGRGQAMRPSRHAASRPMPSERPSSTRCVPRGLARRGGDSRTVETRLGPKSARRSGRPRWRRLHARRRLSVRGQGACSENGGHRYAAQARSTARWTELHAVVG